MTATSLRPSPSRLLAAGLLVTGLIIGGTAAISAMVPGRDPDAAVRPPPLAAPSAPVAAAALRAAQRWAEAARTRDDEQSAAWLARLAPSTTPELLGVLETEADPAAAPRQVTGPAQGVAAEPGSALVRVPTDLGPLLITLVLDERSGWLVAAVEVGPR